ncbi:MAG: hypothetical protein KF715_09765 [Candidatus Didemnitutus sp.]|nr:hypothetical protein [Candidatus Didemnitutus sp.]
MNPEKMNPDELEQFIHRELRALPARKAPADFAARFEAKLAARHAQTASAPQAAFSSAQLEQLVHAELRALPPRRAPRTLEARVMAAIEQRSQVAWWHKSWSYWPAGVKAAFATASTGLVVAAVYGLTLVGRAPQAGVITQEVGERVQFLSSIVALGTWMVEFAGRVLGGIPAPWLYGGIAVVAMLYASFFGLGAVAYRTLYRTHS